MVRASSLPHLERTLTVVLRLLELSANYFDLKEFKDGETKRALQRVANKRAGKPDAFIEDGRKSKKAKTVGRR